MKLATETTIPHGTHTLLAVDLEGGRATGFFFATVTLTGGSAWVCSDERCAGKGEAYSRREDGTWATDDGRVIALHARV